MDELPNLTDPADMSHTHALKVRKGMRATEDAEVVSLVRNAGKLRCAACVNEYIPVLD